MFLVTVADKTVGYNCDGKASCGYCCIIRRCELSQSKRVFTHSEEVAFLTDWVPQEGTCPQRATRQNKKDYKVCLITLS